MSETAEPVRHHAVVVGVSPRTGSVAALRWAATEADLRHAELYAVTAWRPPRPPSTAGALMPAVYQDPDTLSAQATEDLQRHVADVLGSDRVVECRVVHGGKVETLLKVAAVSELLVLDAPRRTARATAKSLSTKLLRSAECPVVVLPFAMHEEPVRFTGVLPQRRDGSGLTS